MNDITGSTVSAVKFDILGNPIAPVTVQSNFFANALISESIPFNAEYVSELMAEARTRIEKIAKPYPGVWAWAKNNRPEMITKVNEYKLGFVKVTELQDLPACHKWLFAFEQSAKRIIETYSKFYPAAR